MPWPWWQVILFILGCIALGLAIGYLIYYLIFRLPSDLKKKALAIKPKVVPKRSEDPVVPVVGPKKPSASNLFVEIERNHLIATLPWSGNLLAFQTEVWDSNRDEVHSLPASLRDELTQAYFDMSLANSIVWLATELGRRSQNLDDSYMKLCASIAERLNNVKQPIRQLWLEK